MADFASFEGIYRRYYPDLLVYGTAIAGDEALVEDAIQELFMALWRQGENLEPKRSLENYLFVSLRNNLYRKLNANRTTILDFDPADDPTDPDMETDREARLAALLRQLPPRQREVIYLRYYQQKSFREIADLLGIRYQVAHNFAHRAIRFLRRHMQCVLTVLPSLTW